MELLEITTIAKWEQEQPNSYTATKLAKYKDGTEIKIHLWARLHEQGWKISADPRTKHAATLYPPKIYANNITQAKNLATRQAKKNANRIGEIIQWHKDENKLWNDRGRPDIAAKWKA